jgi:hypothetical protein
MELDLFIDLVMDKLNLQGRFIFECSRKVNLSYPAKTKVFGETKVYVGRKE